MVHRPDVRLELGPGGEQPAAVAAGEQLLRHELARLVDVVLAGAVAGQRHGRRVLGGAVLTGERAVGAGKKERN